MQHLEHDRLVFLALGESEVDVSDRTHLDACPHCRAELDSLRHVAGLGAAGQELRDLPDPPEHVWQGIMAEITAAEELPRLADRQRPDVTDPVTTGTPPPVPRRSRRGRWSRLATTAVTAVAAATVAVIGTAAVLRDGTPAEPTVLASAPLAAYGSTPPTAVVTRGCWAAASCTCT